MRAVDLSGVVFESIGDPMTLVFCLDRDPSHIK